MNVKCSCCHQWIEIQALPASATIDVICDTCKTALQRSDLANLRQNNPAFPSDFVTSKVWMPTPGETVCGFKIREEIGHGTFGFVFRATDVVLQREVALKVPRVVSVDHDHVQSLIHEARAAAKMRHPNIVSVHEIRCNGEKVFIVSDFIEGRTLDDVESLVEFDYVDAAGFAAKLARAIHYAHLQGIVHRDLKPTNIIVDERGEPHITDFGVALHDFCGINFADFEGRPNGRNPHVAPERAFSSDANVDPRLDVYSLGAILYQLLCHRVENNVRTDRLIDSAFQRNGTEIPQELKSICKKAIEFNASDRYTTAEEFAVELERFIRRETTGELPRRSTGVRAKIAWVSAAVIAVALTIWSVMSFYQPRTNVVFQIVPDNDGTTDVEKITIWQTEIADNQGILKTRKVADIAPNRSLTFSQSLTPGLYSVDVQKSDGAQHSVFRSVPSEVIEPINPVATSVDWEPTSTNSVRWRDIELHGIRSNNDGTYDLGPEKMVKIEGGSFEFGSDSFRDPFSGKLLYPFRKVSVASFFVGEREVTTGNFLAVMEDLPIEMKLRFGGEIPADIPVTNVSYDLARLYCERVGGRLPSVVEYVFVASNRGETKFPWGDSPPEIKEINGCISMMDDKTNCMPFVYDLYGSVKEWTTDINVPYMLPAFSKEMREEIRRSAMATRISAGGDLSDWQSQDPDRIASMPGVRHFESGSLNQNVGQFQGFRVYR